MPSAKLTRQAVRAMHDLHPLSHVYDLPHLYLLGPHSAFSWIPFSSFTSFLNDEAAAVLHSLVLFILYNCDMLSAQWMNRTAIIHLHSNLYLFPSALSVETSVLFIALDRKQHLLYSAPLRCLNCYRDQLTTTDCTCQGGTGTRIPTTSL